MPRKSSGDSKATARRWVRPLVIVVAACVIAFSGWSLAEYAQGADPFGWLLSQDALQTTADEPSAPSNANGNEADAGAGADDAGEATANENANASVAAASQGQPSSDEATSGGDTGQDDATTAGEGANSPSQAGDAGTSTATSPSASSSAATSSQPSSQSSGQAQRDPQAITVSVTIDGSPAGGSRHASTVELSPGANVYDALVAADSNINARDTIYGTYVAAIDGLAEKDHGSMSGWVYAVNGVEPNTACSNYVLSSGDTVVWTYVNVE